MPAHHQAEGVIVERQNALIGDLAYCNPQRPQAAPGQFDIRRPRFGGRQTRRPALSLAEHPCEHFAATSLDVERSPSALHPPADDPRISPRRALLARPAVEPGEIPALDWHGRALGDQIIEATRTPHAAIMTKEGLTKRAN